MAKKTNGDTEVTTEAEAPEIATEATQPNNQQEDPRVDLNDIAQMLRMVELAIKRGAYEPNELVAVGSLHGKVNAFLAHQAQLQQAAMAEAGEPNGSN